MNRSIEVFHARSVATVLLAFLLAGANAAASEQVSTANKVETNGVQVSQPKSVQQKSSDHAQVTFAVVNQDIIPLSDYMMALREESRRVFYHGKPTPEQVESFSRDVADQLVDRQLKLQEARRRDITVLDQEVKAEVEALKLRYPDAGGDAGSPFWLAMEKRLQQEKLLTRFKEVVESEVELDNARVRAYFKANPDKFTEPEQQKIAIILLSVAPSANRATWDAAKEEAAGLANRIRGGESFAELASIHSSHGSASEGGDLGYIHKGILGEELQKELDQLELGAVSDPIRILEGYALFVVEARTEPVRHDFAHVAERAHDLAERQAKQDAWEALMSSLRSSAQIELDEEYISQVTLSSD